MKGYNIKHLFYIIMPWHSHDM